MSRTCWEGFSKQFGWRAQKGTQEGFNIMTDILIAGIIVLLRLFMYEQHLALNNNCRLLHYLLHLLSIVPIHSRVSQKYNDAFERGAECV